MRSYWENDIYKIVDSKREDSLVYKVQPEKSQDEKKRRAIHRNMPLPCEAILEDPKGFHLKKEKHKPKQVASHNFADNASDTESSENKFQWLTAI